MGNHSPIKHCSQRLLSSLQSSLSAQLKLWEGTCTTNPPKTCEREIRARNTTQWAREEHGKPLSTYIWNTDIKWHHRWVAICILLTLLQVICFCFRVACCVFAVNAAENCATWSHRREQWAGFIACPAGMLHPILQGSLPHRSTLRLEIFPRLAWKQGTEGLFSCVWT